MLKMADTSTENLYAVLEIINDMQREYDEGQFKPVTQICFQKMIENSDVNLPQFFHVILTKITQREVIIKCLECLGSLAKFKVMDILLYSELFGAIVAYLESEDTFAAAVEVFFP